jgi:hypothetical protein
MKKIILLPLLICLLSCGASKTVKQSEKSLKGNWVLEDMSSTVVGELNFTIFGQSSRNCIIGSSWEFIPNNNTGSYMESGSACNAEENYFVFSIDEVDAISGFYDFLLKPTDAKGKSETNKGYRLELVSLTGSTMVWKHTISFEGRPATLTFNFIKS